MPAQPVVVQGDMLTVFAISHQDGGDMDGIHLLWSPPYPTGYALNGFTIQRRMAQEQDAHRCFEIPPNSFADARQLGFVDLPEARIWASPWSQKTPTTGPWVYRVHLHRPHHRVEISGSGAICAFAARSDGQIVDGEFFNGNVCRLSGSSITVLWLIANNTMAPFQICGAVDDPRQWQPAKPIVDGLQVPFRAVNSDVGNTAEERELAASRAAPEPLDGDFAEVSRYANMAYVRPFGLPAFQVLTRDPDAKHGAWDAAPLGFMLAACVVSAPWRRGLGFGHLDQDGLVDGAIYDYRISGLVPRAERDELRLDFHTVPRNFRLPIYFLLGEHAVFCLPAPTVTAQEKGGPSPRPVVKGINFDFLRLALARSTSRIVIDGRSDAALNIEGIKDHAPAATFSQQLSGRTVIDFGTPVDDVVLRGRGFLEAFVADPLAAGLDPKEPVEVSAAVYGVAYVPTAQPDPPQGVQVQNLGSATRTASQGHQDANSGFEITWDAPARLSAALMAWWPRDAHLVPPTDVGIYLVERSWDGHPRSASEETGGIHVASRNREPVADSPAPGFDVLSAFPPANMAGRATSHRVTALEAHEGDDPAFGSMLTYAVSSVDAIGRRSVPTMAAPHQLQKLTRPPEPIAPPTALDGSEELVAPQGVQARLLQATDPDLTQQESDLVTEAQSDLVVLSWGWGPKQRELDPHVTAFRIYEHDSRLIEVRVKVLAPPAAHAGGGWVLTCQVDREVSPNEFAGRTIVLGAAYDIASHTGGLTPSIVLAASAVSPGASPHGDAFSLIRTDGAEAHPGYWDRRLPDVELRPTTPPQPNETEHYTRILPAGWITVGPGNPKQFRTFGVSAADAEDYVPDRRSVLGEAQLLGNESVVASAEVVARYRGQPTLVIADLGPVASVTLHRSPAVAVYMELTLANFLPASAPIAKKHMRIERAPIGAALRRIIVDAGPIRLAGRNPSDPVIPWVLSAADEALLRAEAATRSISDRFIAHAASRLADLGGDFETVADADPTVPYRDMLPNSPARWLYRLRALDQAKHPSAEGQVLELVVRVPPPARAVSPELVDLILTDATAEVTVEARGDAGEAVFLVTSAVPSLKVAEAELATIRNRPDLADADRIVVRDDRGTVLPLTLAAPGLDGRFTKSFPAPDDHRFHVWALSVTSDGVPSRLIGPLHVVRGRPVEGA